MVVPQAEKRIRTESRVLPARGLYRGTPKRTAAFLGLLEAAGLDRSAPLRGAEVGVWRGGFSRWLLLNLPRAHLVMIDRWAPARPGDEDWRIDEPGARATRAERRHHKAVACRNTAFAAKRRRLLEADSVEAAAEIADGSLDFVFIDASHTRQAAFEDLRAWAPKVRKGGLVSGDDIDHPRTCPASAFWDVRGAVEDYAADAGAVDLWLAPEMLWGFVKA